MPGQISNGVIRLSVYRQGHHAPALASVFAPQVIHAGALQGAKRASAGPPLNQQGPTSLLCQIKTLPIEQTNARHVQTATHLGHS
jgi:hypothetical protein